MNKNDCYNICKNAKVLISEQLACLRTVYPSVINFDGVSFKKDSVLFNYLPIEGETSSNVLKYKPFDKSIDIITNSTLLNIFTIIEENLRQVLALYYSNKNGSNDLKKEYKEISKNTFGKIIIKIFEIIPQNLHKSEMEEYLKLRNCLAHRLGFVGKNDLNKKGNLKITWEELQFYIDGKVITSLPIDPTDYERKITFNKIIKIKEWKLKEIVKVTPQEVQGIGFYLFIVFQDIFLDIYNISSENKINKKNILHVGFSYEVPPNNGF